MGSAPVWIVEGGFELALLGVFSTEARANDCAASHDTKERQRMLDMNREYPELPPYSDEEIERHMVYECARITCWTVDRGKTS